MGLRMTTNMVNEFCRTQNVPSFTMGPVHTAFKKLKPKVCKIKQRPQGSTDKDAPWSKARLNWVTQLLIRFGKLESQVDPATGHPPAYFDSEKLTKLTKLTLEQVAWFDETHRKCTIGNEVAGSISSKTYVRFPRDADGKLDLENGTYDDNDRVVRSVVLHTSTDAVEEEEDELALEEAQNAVDGEGGDGQE